MLIFKKLCNIISPGRDRSADEKKLKKTSSLNSVSKLNNKINKQDKTLNISRIDSSIEDTEIFNLEVINLLFLTR